MPSPTSPVISHLPLHGVTALRNQNAGFLPFVKIKFNDFSRTFKDHMKDI